MNTKKIILTLYVGIIALSTLGLSFSLAWYASSSQLHVDSIEIALDCDRDLKISTSSNFENLTDILSREEDFEFASSFDTVTSAHSRLWMDSKEDKPRFYDDTTWYSGREEAAIQEASIGYFSQDVYLYCDDDVFVTIDPEMTYLNASQYNYSHAQEMYDIIQRVKDESSPYYKYKNLTVEEIKTRLDELVKAMRFSILIPNDDDSYDYVIIDPHKEEETYLGGLLDVDVDRYYDSHHNSNDSVYYENVYGEVNDRSLIVYDDPLTESSDYTYPGDEPSAFNARHESGVKLFNREKSIQNGFEIKVENSHSLDEFNHRLNTPLNIPVYKDKANKIIFSIYIEGWDLQSVNYTMGATFDSYIKFIIAREM